MLFSYVGVACLLFVFLFALRLFVFVCFLSAFVLFSLFVFGFVLDIWNLEFTAKHHGEGKFRLKG